MKSQPKKRTVKVSTKRKSVKRESPSRWNLKNVITALVIAAVAFAIIFLSAQVMGSGPITIEEYADKLSECKEGKYKLKTPAITGYSSETPVEIKGTAGGKCTAITQMPNNGIQTCKYPEASLGQVAKDYKESVSKDTSTSVSFNENESNVESNNPLQKYLDDGTCVITGY